jgi:glycosyltransferase involved in cell wall biosynthesis
MFFSIIVPVFNRPDEVQELLESLCRQDFAARFEVVIVEDGSTNLCKAQVDSFKEKLEISYYYKQNSGPGDSRNFGMNVAKGDYFIIFDSDCIIPPNYLLAVLNELNTDFVDCFGGADAALDSFSAIQKAINFAMTSFLTTGGIRGGSEKIIKFQPRSFNMGISKKAFEKSSGFGNIHPGEDPDLSIRLWNLGFETRLFPEAFVYHKRRIDWEKFFIQVNKFGKARPILNKWHPKYAKITFFVPTIFMIGLTLSILLALINFTFFLCLYGLYFAVIVVASSYQNKSVKIGLFSVLASFIQFYGYGTGFLKSYVYVQLLNKDPKEIFPELFFKSSK